MLTFTVYPLSLVAWLAVTIATLIAPLRDVLPVVFAVLAIVLADVATRDVRAGTMNSLRAIPRLRENYVWWKLGSVCLLSLFFCAAALLRTIPDGRFALLALGVGIFFVGATATALGVVTNNPKTFIVGFLSFWYLVVNDHGVHAIWDFAGFYGRATPGIVGGYFLLGAAGLSFAQLLYRVRLTRA